MIKKAIWLTQIGILFLFIPGPLGGSLIFAQQTPPDSSPRISPRQLQSPTPVPIPGVGPSPSPTSGKPSEPAATTPNETLNPVPFTPNKPSNKKEEVSFNFDDADVYSVIQTIFGGVLKFNYVIDPKVKGRVNFRSVAPLAREDVLPLMEVILRLNGIGVLEDGGLYRIIPIGDMPKEPAPVRIGREPDKVPLQGLGLLQVVPIKFISSTEMVKVLTPFLSTNALIVDVPKINFLILVDTDANIKRLLQLVEIFDSEHIKKIKFQVFVYPVQNTKAKDLASLLQQIFLGAKAPTKSSSTTTSTAGTGSTTRTTSSIASKPAATATQTTPQTQPDSGEILVSESTKIIADEGSNSLITLATPDDYVLIQETVKKLDIVPRQVMIEVLISEITLGDDLEFGLQWSVKSRVDSGFVNYGFQTKASDDTTSQGFTFLGIDKTGLIRNYLRALATDSKLVVLASPHILALDNQKAKIQIGDQIPIVTSESNVSGTTDIQRTIQYKDTGTMLEVTPLINDGGLVRLEINQEVSDYSLKKLYNTDYPVIHKRETKTNLVVQDGQTIVIGGLIRDKSDKTREGIPWLSKIPILGYLFGSTSKQQLRSEIVVLLTPKVIRNQKEAEDLTSIYLHKLNGAKHEINKMDLLMNNPKEKTPPTKENIPKE